MKEIRTLLISSRRVAQVLLLFGVAVGFAGYFVSHPNDNNVFSVINQFYANISTELISIGITVLWIDGLNKLHNEYEKMDDYVFQMSSPDNGLAREALRNLRRKGWLINGLLNAANLRYANLESASLSGANLRMVNLSYANLKKVKFTDTNLEKANLKFANLRGSIFISDDQLKSLYSLYGAIMPDGRVYNGKYSLAGDLEIAHSKGIDTTSKKKMAKFYSEARKDYHSAQLYD
ncbi:MAG TPA: pentapeptide repeat-containing protein [Anaerolineales bacterium]|nr:pentapeptide repeat-containing protein [Anaerolineales bacterium]